MAFVLILSALNGESATAHRLVYIFPSEEAEEIGYDGQYKPSGDDFDKEVMGV